MSVFGLIELKSPGAKTHVEHIRFFRKIEGSRLWGKKISHRTDFRTTVTRQIFPCHGTVHRQTVHYTVTRQILPWYGSQKIWLVPRFPSYAIKLFNFSYGTDLNATLKRLCICKNAKLITGIFFQESFNSHPLILIKYRSLKSIK